METFLKMYIEYLYSNPRLWILIVLALLTQLYILYLNKKYKR